MDVELAIGAVAVHAALRYSAWKRSACAGAVVVEAIARGVLTGALAERRRRRAIERLRDHYIICGFGRVGRHVAEEFRRAGAPFVVLDYSEEAIEHAREEDILFIEGNATE